MWDVNEEELFSFLLTLMILRVFLTFISPSVCVYMETEGGMTVNDSGPLRLKCVCV